MSRLPAVILSILVAIAATACSAGAGAAPGGEAASAGGFIVVSGAWVRAAPEGGTTAAYLQVVNGRLSDDVLVGVSTDVAARASLHETTTDQGMTGMQHTDGITIGAGRTVLLEPGGYHIMLEGLTEDLAAGGSVRLVLTFEQSGPLNVTAEIRAS